MKLQKFLKKYGFAIVIILLLGVNLQSFGQYVSPNQPGRKGGNTQPSDPSLNAVVTSTYFGTNGSLSGQGTLIASDKNPPVGSTGSNTRVLHFFKGATTDASYSWYTSPFTATDGNLYGNSYYGGTSNLGATYTYKVDQATSGTCIGNNQVIYNMGGTGGSYGNYANLNELSDGKLYVPETAGGTGAFGKMTRMDKNGTNVQTIHDFTYGVGPTTAIYSAGAQAQPNFATYAPFYGYDGAYPYGFPTEGPDGMLYGTTLWGGVGISGQAYGTVYKMNKDGSGYKILAFGSTLSAGTYNTADGSTVAGVMPFAIPVGNVAFDQAGVYGYFFGSYVNATNWGNVCRVKLDGSAPVEIVHTFGLTGTTPKSLYRGPIIINNMLYGTSVNGGTTNYGTIWSLDLSKLNATDNPIDANGVNNTLVKLHDFNVTDGAYPYASLIYDGTFLYGSTQQGGSSPNAYGTIFKMKPDGTGFQTILITENATNNCPAGTPLDQQVFGVYYPGAERVTLVKLPASTLTCFSCIKNGCSVVDKTPGIVATTATNVCPATTFNLGTLTDTATGIPTGAVLKWSSANPATAATILASTSVGAGKYYAVYKDTVNNCYSKSDSITVSIISCVSADSIKCSSITLAPAPVTGTASQIDMIIQIYVSAAGCRNITVSGSGMTLANSVTQVCPTAPGFQSIHVPLNYNGGALGTITTTITGVGTCATNLTSPAMSTPKKVVMNVLTADNCLFPQLGPELK